MTDVRGSWNEVGVRSQVDEVLDALGDDGPDRLLHRMRTSEQRGAAIA